MKRKYLAAQIWLMLADIGVQLFTLGLLLPSDILFSVVGVTVSKLRKDQSSKDGIPLDQLVLLFTNINQFPFNENGH